MADPAPSTREPASLADYGEDCSSQWENISQQ
jgi:RNA polymerase sigma-70 factor (ECF subfamily)